MAVGSAGALLEAVQAGSGTNLLNLPIARGGKLEMDVFWGWQMHASPVSVGMLTR